MKKLYFKYFVLGLSSIFVFTPLLSSCFSMKPLANDSSIENHSLDEHNSGTDIENNSVPLVPLEPSKPTDPPKPVEPEVTPDIDGNSGGTPDVSINKITRPKNATEMDSLIKPFPSLNDLYGSGTSGNDYSAEAANNMVKATEGAFNKFKNETGGYFGWYKQEFDYQARFLKWLNFDNFKDGQIAESDIYVVHKNENSITYEMQALLAKDINFMFYAPYDDSHLNNNTRKLSAGDLIKIKLEFRIPAVNMIRMPIDHSNLRYPWSVSPATLSSWDPVKHKTLTLKSMVFGGQFDVSVGFDENWKPIPTPKSEIKFTVETKSANGDWMHYLSREPQMRLKLLSINKKTVQFS